MNKATYDKIAKSLGDAAANSNERPAQSTAQALIAIALIMLLRVSRSVRSPAGSRGSQTRRRPHTRGSGGSRSPKEEPHDVLQPDRV